MQNFSAQCLCLRSIDYKENDKLVTLYAAGKGKMIAVVKSCNSAKSKLKFAAMPMNFATYEFVEKKGRITVTGCEQIESFFSITNDIIKYAAACVVLEFLEKSTVECEYNQKQYITTLKFFRALVYDNYPIDALLLRYLNIGLIQMGYDIKESIKDIKKFLENEVDIRINSLDLYTKLV